MTWLRDCMQSVRLVDLLDEARERCRVTIKERRGDDISPEELEESACAMGYGAVKYADLKNNRLTNYKYTPSFAKAHAWLRAKRLGEQGSGQLCAA